MPAALLQVLDSDKSGGLESAEFCAAIRKLVSQPLPPRAPGPARTRHPAPRPRPPAPGPRPSPPPLIPAFPYIRDQLFRLRPQEVGPVGGK